MATRKSPERDERLIEEFNKLKNRKGSDVVGAEGREGSEEGTEKAWQLSGTLGPVTDSLDHQSWPIRIRFGVMPKLRLSDELATARYLSTRSHLPSLKHRKDQESGTDLRTRPRTELIIRWEVLAICLPGAVMVCSCNGVMGTLTHIVAGNSEPRRGSHSDRLQG